jgi:hypothetical protein
MLPNAQQAAAPSANRSYGAINQPTSRQIGVVHQRVRWKAIHLG